MMPLDEMRVSPFSQVGKPLTYNVYWHGIAEICERLDRIASAVEREHNLRAETNSGEEWKLRERAEKAEAELIESQLAENNVRVTLREQREIIVRETSRANKAEARLSMHPDGRCRCAGEGTCQWCRLIATEARVWELEQLDASHYNAIRAERDRALDFARRWKEIAYKAALNRACFEDFDGLAAEEDAGK